MATLYNQQPFNQRKRLYVVQALSVFAAFLFIFSRPTWESVPLWHEVVELSGFALILVCIFGRLWSILYVGSKKNIELVSIGPYSMMRNPLYFFSTIGALGIGLMYGSFFLCLILGAASYIIFTTTARKEAQFLSGKFGREYEVYAAKTPLFFPNPKIYKDVDGIVFSPKALMKTFLDLLYFFAIFPIIEFVEYLHDLDVIPILFEIY